MESITAGIQRATVVLDQQDMASWDPWAAYGQAKLANVLHAAELGRRCAAANLPVSVVAVEPGNASCIPLLSSLLSQCDALQPWLHADILTMTADCSQKPLGAAGHPHNYQPLPFISLSKSAGLICSVIAQGAAPKV